MDLNRLTRKSDAEWWVVPTGKMRVPGAIFATEKLVQEMDEKVFEQVSDVATLPGIVKASFDVHAVADATDQAQLASKVAKLLPLIVIKG